MRIRPSASVFSNEHKSNWGVPMRMGSSMFVGLLEVAIDWVASRSSLLSGLHLS